MTIGHGTSRLAPRPAPFPRGHHAWIGTSTITTWVAGTATLLLGADVGPGENTEAIKNHVSDPAITAPAKDDGQPGPARVDAAAAVARV